MIEIELPANGWRPRDYQRPAWEALKSGIKRSLWIWHRRAGKDDAAMHWTAREAIASRPGTYWHMLPEAAQSRKAIWEAINPRTSKRRIDDVFPHELRTRTRDTDMLIELKCIAGARSTWQVVGSDNYRSLLGSPPVGIVLSEWALADPEAWAYLRPILAENDGWALFVTTPRGHNHAATMFSAYEHDESWFVQRLPADQTGVFTAAQLTTERDEYIKEFGPSIGRLLYQQEYECSFDAPVLGAYYADLVNDAEKQDRITEVPHNPGLKVETWWDIGGTDATAIWFVQREGLRIRVFDYYEASGAGIEHYAKVLHGDDPDMKRCAKYLYGDHVWPHDGANFSFDTGKKRYEIAEGLGFRPKIVPKHDVRDGIQAVRTLLPQCWFDAGRCERGLLALRQYRAEWNDQTKALKQSAVHDWTSHPADAFRYGAMHRPSVKRGPIDIPTAGVV